MIVQDTGRISTAESDAATASTTLQGLSLSKQNIFGQRQSYTKCINIKLYHTHFKEVTHIQKKKQRWRRKERRPWALEGANIVRPPA